MSIGGLLAEIGPKPVNGPSPSGPGLWDVWGGWVIGGVIVVLIICWWRRNTTLSDLRSSLTDDGLWAFFGKAAAVIAVVLLIVWWDTSREREANRNGEPTAEVDCYIAPQHC